MQKLQKLKKIPIFNTKHTKIKIKITNIRSFFTTLEYHRLIKICLKNKRSRKVLLVDDALGLGDKNRIIIEKCKPLSIFIACEMHL